MENRVKVDFVQGVEQEPNLVGSCGGKAGHALEGVESHHRERSKKERRERESRARKQRERERAETNASSEELGLKKVILFLFVLAFSCFLEGAGLGQFQLGKVC